ncbi:MAG: LegC family aminotransferase [Anaeromicrobium sp.]|jgi:perosamine synthetase|uniref:LegC family aminotransferase n=1 Tax=Anaeromicrobium sp. TaxID=1929132 RepID=UPI0025EE9D4A|nr:LegC family aminotransferase [Anaeromicrobium sp.]MCT4593960.1 LegC family aminotransferase [Anaeromicrobium sp.]
MSNFIPLSIPNFKGKELEYVTKAVETEWVSTGGAYIDQFEEQIAQYLNVGQAVACQSGTAGLHLALKLSGVEYADEVIVPTLTFIAAVNPVRYLGAEPVFMDCDDTLNIDLDKLEEFCNNECHLTEKGLVNKKTNKVIKAMAIVHVFGNIANMERVMNIAQKYKLKVIEDATEALGSYYLEGKYEGKYAGTIGDFGVYSFNGNKIITTGGGGMLVGQNNDLVSKAKYLSTQAKDDTLYYIHDEVGYNYRMTNLQAALGVAQLEQLEKFIETKKRNYHLYKTEIDELKGLELLNFNKNIRPNYWFYSLAINKEQYGLDRDQLLRKLNESGIQTRPIWGLNHEQKPYVNNEAYKIEKAKYYLDRVLNIPCSTNLEEKDVLRVANILKALKYSL